MTEVSFLFSATDYLRSYALLARHLVRNWMSGPKGAARLELCRRKHSWPGLRHGSVLVAALISVGFCPMIRSGSCLSGFRLLFPGAGANIFVEARFMKHKDLVDAMGANKRAELYFAEHPGSPAAVRRPQLSIRSGTWVAVLGPNVQDGI